MPEPYECCYIAGRCSHAECGAYPYPVEPEPPQPTIEDYCASGGHGYAGDDGDHGRCYCGQRTYSPGGPEVEHSGSRDEPDWVRASRAADVEYAVTVTPPR